MVELRVGPRLTLAEQMSRNPAFRGRLLAVGHHSPGENLLRANETIGKDAKALGALYLEVDKLRNAAPVSIVLDVSKASMIDMIDDPSLPFRVTKCVIPVSLLDGRRIAAEFNDQNPGRKLRVPTEKELLKLNRLLGDKLSHAYWIWTETKYEDQPWKFVLLHLGDSFRGYRYYFTPDSHLDHRDAVRFVEDK